MTPEHIDLERRNQRLHEWIKTREGIDQQFAQLEAQLWTAESALRRIAAAGQGDAAQALMEIDGHTS